MAPLPKRRLSTRRQRMRAKNIKISFSSVSPCKNCAAPVRPHHVCPKCGFYKNEEIVKIKTKAKKKE